MPSMPFPTPSEEFDDFKNQVWEMFRQLYEESYGGYEVGEEITGISVGVGTTIASGNILYFADYYAEQEETTTETDFDRVKIMQLSNAGEYKIWYQAKISAGETGYTQLYRNGEPIAGTQRTVTNTSYSTKGWIQDGWSAGDTLEIWGKVTGGTLYIRYLILKADTFSSYPIALPKGRWGAY